MDRKLLDQILDALTNANGMSLLVLETLWSCDVRHGHHRASILNRMPDLFSLLSERSPQQLEVAITMTAAASYQNKVQDLIQPQTGFHFTGNKTNLNQLKTFSITQMGVKIQEVAPNLWDLFGIQLDADPNWQCTAPSDKVTDEDVEIELADIWAVCSQIFLLFRLLFHSENQTRPCCHGQRDFKICATRAKHLSTATASFGSRCRKLSKY